MRAESLWWPRLRWRMRGAWQWPSFFGLTLLDAVIVTALPFSGDGPGELLGGLLLAGFFNLFVVAALAPLVGWRLRRRRPDLPRLVANDYAGTALLVLLTLVLVAGGVAHRPARLGEADDQRAVAASVHDYVVAQAPHYRAGLVSMDALQVEAELYRACVPGPGTERPLCLFVSTAQRPAGVTRDHDQNPNSVYRSQGGFE